MLAVVAGTVVVAILVALAVHRVVLAVARRALLESPKRLRESFLESARGPARILLVLLAVRAVVPALGLSPDLATGVGRALVVGLILAVAWLAVELIEVVQVAIELRFPADVPDNLRARRVRTKVRMLRRVVTVVVGVVALAVILMTFPSVRRLGLSLFASAGVAGLVVGIAAQPTLSNVVAGLQLALTEPIRLDDVVIVEGEWGRIEEIHMTYVVIAI